MHNSIKPKKNYSALNIEQRANIDTLSGSIIFNQIALNYNEKLKHTKYYRHDLKSAINRIVPILIQKEEQEFDKVFDEDSEMVSAVADNVQKGIELLLTKPFHELTMITQIFQCYELDKETMETTMARILIKNL